MTISNMEVLKVVRYFGRELGFDSVYAFASGESEVDRDAVDLILRFEKAMHDAALGLGDSGVLYDVEKACGELDGVIEAAGFGQMLGEE